MKKTPWHIALRGELSIWANLTLLWSYLAARDHSAGLWVAAVVSLLTVLLEVNCTLHRRNDPSIEHEPCGCPVCKAVGDA